MAGSRSPDDITHLELRRRPRASRSGLRMWREWCFLLVAFRHFRLRFLCMAAILAGGAFLFHRYEPRGSLMEEVFDTWSLVFGEPPPRFPDALLLRLMCFVIPILGLTVIIEGIIDFALMVRDRQRYERSWCIMLAKSFKNHVVLVGFGRLGYRTFLLLRKMGEPVVVIEHQDQGDFIDELRREGSPLILGDARREVLLENANIAKARSIVLATDDDMVNLEAALDARRLNPRIRVVLRMYDENIARKVGEGFDLDSAMSQAGLSAPWFASAAVQPGIINSFIVNDRLIVMQRWLVRQEGPLAGRAIGELANELGVNVVEHRRPDEAPVLFPPLDVTLRPGDGLIVQGPFEVIDSVRAQVLGV